MKTFGKRERDGTPTRLPALTPSGDEPSTEQPVMPGEPSTEQPVMPASLL